MEERIDPELEKIRQEEMDGDGPLYESSYHLDRTLEQDVLIRKQEREAAPLVLPATIEAQAPEEYDVGGVNKYILEGNRLDGFLENNLQVLRQAVKLNWDGVLLFGGMEGAGKSTLGAQCAAYLDPTFYDADAVRRTCFTLEQLKKAVDDARPGQAVVYDESWKDMNSGARYGKNQQEIIRMLTEKRKKRLYWIIVAPTFFDITKYLAIHRSRAYIHVYAKGLQRGFFKFYGPDHKQDLYIRGKKDWNMYVVKPTFHGRFTKWIPYDREEYERKKDEATKADAEKKPENIVLNTEEISWNTVKNVLALLDLKGYLKRGAKSYIAGVYNRPESTLGDGVAKAKEFLRPAPARDLENGIAERGDPEEEEVVE